MVLLGIAPPLVVVGGTVLSCPGVNPLDLWGDPILHQDIWRAHNPYDLADRLRGLPLYVSSGTGAPGPHDPPLIPDLLEGMIWRLNDAFVRKLKELEIPATVHLYNGTHTWPYWNRELHSAFPLLLAALD
jgi:S-formylglutathione hydrolase FrmB